MRHTLIFLLAFLGMAPTPAKSESWSDSILGFLAAGNSTAVIAKIRQPPQGCSAAVELSNLHALLKNNPTAAAFSMRFRFRLDDLLERGFAGPCASLYLAAIEDASLAPSARISFLKALLNGAPRLKGSVRDSVIIRLGNLVDNSATPIDLKYHLVKRAPIASESDAPMTYKALLTHEVPSIRSAATVAMVKRVRMNHKSGATGSNQDIFKEFSHLLGDSLSMDQVRILASISADYARDFLYTHCNGNAEKIATIYYRDDSLAHTPIVKESLRLVNAGGDATGLSQAIRIGLKHPDRKIQEFMAGDASDLKFGFLLLTIFPEFAAHHIGMIADNLNSPVQEIKTAAIQLSDYLQNSNEATP